MQLLEKKHEQNEFLDKFFQNYNFDRIQPKMPCFGF